jgi:hypothetical protein
MSPERANLFLYIGVAAVGIHQREAGAGLHLGKQGVQRHPSQAVPSLDQWVTQWMSTVTGSLGRARRGAQSQLVVQERHAPG